MASFPACCRRSCKKRIESRRGGIKRSLIANRKEVGTGASRVERAKEIDIRETRSKEAATGKIRNGELT